MKSKAVKKKILYKCNKINMITMSNVIFFYWSTKKTICLVFLNMNILHTIIILYLYVTYVFEFDININLQKNVSKT